MEPFLRHTGIAAPLPLANVDTDMLAPAEAMQTVERTGLGVYLFARLRYLPDGSEDPGFVLNRPEFRGASLLVAGENFGCGSSREVAVWALRDFGIRAVIAPGFADIFALNASRNGLLLVALPQAEVDRMLAAARTGSALTIDLPAQEILPPEGGPIPFEIDPFRKQLLLSGTAGVEDAAGLLREVLAFEARQRRSRPWLWA